MLQISQKARPLSDFCKDNGIGLTKAYQEIGAGRLVARKVGRRTIVLDEDARRWAETLPTVGCKPARNPAA